MMYSEFYERTKVNLTPDEYALVEKIYNAVQMNKDEFCKWWLKNRNNKLYQEVADAYLMEASRHRASLTSLNSANETIRMEFEEYKSKKEKEIDNIIDAHNNAHNEFGKRIVRANCDGNLRVEEVIEEEFGYGFIIRAKHEAGIPLSNEEISYMVGKL